MAPRKAHQEQAPKRRPATTLEDRENQLISLAIDEAEKQIRNGTASSQVITHFLKLGSTREQKEQLRIEYESQLQLAKIEQLQSNARIEELYSDAIAAMRSYNGQDDAV